MHDSIPGLHPRRFQWRLRAFVLSVTVSGASLGLIGILACRPENQGQRHEPWPAILERGHAAFASVQGDDVLWLCLNEWGIVDLPPELHQAGVTKLYSHATGWEIRGSPVYDASLEQLLNETPDLRGLDIRDTATTASVLPRIAELKKLEWLWLDAGHCDDTSINVLTRMSRLRHLYIDGMGLSQAELLRFREALPNCDIQRRDRASSGSERSDNPRPVRFSRVSGIVLRKLMACLER